MSDRKNDAWADALAGRRDDGSPDAREGSALRRAILALAPTADGASAAPDPRREDELLERARGEGLIAGAGAAPRIEGRSLGAAAWLLGWRGAAAAAAVVAAVGLAVVLRRPVQPEAVRGPVDGIARIDAADPAALQSELIRELHASGVEATGYERLGRAGVDADLPRPVPLEVRRILARHGLPVPEDGVLRVEIRPR